MIGPPSDCRIFLAARVTDLRKGFDSLGALVQQTLQEDPNSGALFVFRGRSGDRIKVLWCDGQGMCLYYKRLDDGTFVWPRATSGAVSLSYAQLAMLIEGIDWRRPKRRSQRPQLSV